MIIDFRCSNFRSIESEVSLNLFATSDDSFEETLIKYNGERFSRIAEIYGSNGSGKTTLLDALFVMCYMVRSCYYEAQPDNSEIKYHYPHKLQTDKPTKFSLWFVKNDKKYFYSFEYNEKEILTESLYYVPGSRIARIFERNNLEFIPGDSFRESLRPIGVIQEKKLALSIAANTTNDENIREVFDFFNNDILFFQAQDKPWRQESARILASDSAKKEMFESFLRRICPGLLQVHISLDNNIYSMWSVYEGFSLNIFNEESSGVKALCESLCMLYMIMEEGKTLVCDEWERTFHPEIIRELVNLFIKNNKTAAQVIFSTHCLELLDLDMVRRDQIWFTELDSSRHKTNLYSLIAIKNVRKDENIRKRYLEGRYGAIPLHDEYSEEINDKTI